MVHDRPYINNLGGGCVYALDRNDWVSSIVHYGDVIMSAMASQITGVSIVYSAVCSGAGQTNGEFLTERASNAENVPFDDVITSLCHQRALLPVKDRAHLSTFKFFILEKFSCIVVLIVFFVIVQSSGLTSVWFREKMTFFLNFISFHIFKIYVGGACWGLPAACMLIAVSGARLPSVDGLTVMYIKNAPLLNLPSKCVCDLFQTCFRYMYVWYKHTGTLPLCLQVALSFIWLD